MRRGFTLMETVIALILTAVLVLIISTMVPTGVIAVRKSQDVTTATLYATEVLETAIYDPGAQPPRRTLTPTISGMQFEVTCEIYALPNPAQRDVVVVVTWPDQPRPVKLSSSVYQP